ncbi:SPFH domain-containing protein [Nocardia africana]|uniref:Virion core protein (Lumpy skin disease virus) n=1 Tax=Nocardia africana TaxID=134964 RepID=A0A378WNW8_9NOCA|nr:SPFH domain-containing protein [Nocardia africana]SUA42427.1 Putative virion core protein (lumpy skin disease virus) [Nocardia africana]
MAWFEREFIAVPDGRKDQLVYKWPDLNIRRYSRTIVNADQIALFVKSGRVVATMGPGRHRVDADELPVLGALVDTVTGNNFYRAELYFVSTREFAGVKFGGRLDDIVDPASEQIVTLRVFGEFALAVRDPAQLITSLVGTTDLTDPAGVRAWCADLLLKSMKMTVSHGISQGDWQVLGLSAQLQSIESAVVRQTNLTLYEYGMRISRMGNFDITLAPEDAERLKRLAKDVTYIRLAGDFQRYAAGEMALGAGQGMAHSHGGGGEGGFLGAALGLNAIAGMGQQSTVPWASQQSTPPPAQPFPQPAGRPALQPSPAPGPKISDSPPPPPPAGVSATPGSPAASSSAESPLPSAAPQGDDSAASEQVLCASCATDNPRTARFCMHCGTRLAAAPRHCTECGAELPPAARFCGDCGTAAGA